MSRTPAKSLDPRRLDVAALASRGAELAGVWRQSEMPRLSEDPAGEAGDDAAHEQREGREAAAQSAAPGDVQWAARGELRAVRGGSPQVWLHLQASTEVRRTCQRCLQPVSLPMTFDRAFQFVADEDQAAALDAQAEEDVLTLTGSLDLLELVEDEFLLDLPLVPRHAACPNPLSPPSSLSMDTEPEPAHPFAALAALKRGSSGS